MVRIDLTFLSFIALKEKIKICFKVHFILFSQPHYHNSHLASHKQIYFCSSLQSISRKTESKSFSESLESAEDSITLFFFFFRKRLMTKYNTMPTTMSIPDNIIGLINPKIKPVSLEGISYLRRIVHGTVNDKVMLIAKVILIRYLYKYRIITRACIVWYF